MITSTLRGRRSSAKWVQLSRDDRTVRQGIGGPGERESIGLKFQSGNGRVYSYDEHGVIRRMGTAGTRGRSKRKEV